MVRLGVRTVRDLVFETALHQGVFSLAEYSETIEQIRRHSTVTAYIARIVCKVAKVDEDHAFLCGLLHDIGFAGLLVAVSNIEAEDSPPLIQLWPDIDALHEQASRLVTQLWQLTLQDSLDDTISFGDDGAIVFAFSRDPLEARHQLSGSNVANTRIEWRDQRIQINKLTAGCGVWSISDRRGRFGAGV